jgi:hypothetical protein
MQPTGSSPPQFSADGKYWWDGRQWISILSPDGKYRWTGTAWAPVKKMFLGDYANQSIACAVVGILCAPFFPFGLWAGYKAFKELLHKQTQAIVGMVLNAIGVGLWIFSLVFRFAIAPSLR